MWLTGWLRRLSIGERVLLAVFLVSLPLANPLIRGDGVGYYAYLRSLLIDGDLRFENEWLAANASFVHGVTDEAGRIRSDQYTRTGRVANHFTVGPAILWALPVSAVHLLVVAGRRFGLPVPADGYAWPYRTTVALATAAYAFLGLLLAYRIAGQYVPEPAARLATLGIWFGSSLPVYMYFNPAWSHALSAFAVALFLWYWNQTRRDRTVRQWAVLGCLGGLMINVYYPNALVLVAPGVEAAIGYGRAVRGGRPGAVRSLAVAHLACGAAVLLALTPTLATRWIIYGSPLASGHHPPLAQWCWGRPWLGAVLFSSNHGLFAWTPLLLVAVLGLPALRAIDRAFTAALGAVAVAFYYVIASYPAWHGISSFGNRFFVSLTPIFVVGVAAALASTYRRPQLARITPALLLVVVAWNLGLLFQWGTNIVPNRGPVSWTAVAVNQVTVVPRQIARLTGAYFRNRTGLLDVLQREDLKEVETWADPTPACRPASGSN